MNVRKIIEDHADQQAARSGLTEPNRSEARHELVSHLYDRASDLAGGEPTFDHAKQAIADLGDGGVSFFGVPGQIKAPLASRRRRLWAYVLDFTILALLGAAVAGAVHGEAAIIVGYTSHEGVDSSCSAFLFMGSKFWAQSTTPVGETSVCDERARAGGTASLAMFLAALPYFALLEGRTGQSLGKMATKLRAVREDGTALGYGPALGRNVLKGAWFFQLMDMFWWFGPERQRLLERWSHSVVVDVRKTGPQQSNL